MTGAASFGAPWLGLVKSGTTSTTSDSIVVGTASYSLDLRVNTDGNPVSGLQYYITAFGGTVNYGGTPLTALNNPFVSGDIFSSPAAGAVVQQSTGTTVWFKSSAGDYPAFGPNSIGTYQFNSGLLAEGTYVFTPVGEELSNESETITTFASPGTFSLNVLPIPEPGTSALVAFGGLVFLARRRRV
jgi:hypothetical protein